MSTFKNYVIVAPHVDDEVIGCYSLLRAGVVKKVYYNVGQELTEERVVEALNCAELFGFDPVMSNLMVNEVAYSETLLVPHWCDHHPDHKQANQRVRLYKNVHTMFYSVDMNVPGLKVLSAKVQAEKRSALLSLFPSQADYFRNHQEAYLFEGLFENDFIKAEKISGGEFSYREVLP
jgi:hypothetical protein